MFRLTKKIEYALIALTHMNSKSGKGISTAKEIASEHHIPLELMAKILQQLARHEIIRSVQGPRGGYVLERPLHEIPLDEFFTLLEGGNYFVECSLRKQNHCIREDNCLIRLPMVQIDSQLRDYFSKISLKDVTSGHIPEIQIQ